jgi:uncharacterized protein GlcG (DUF336 family)
MLASKILLQTASVLVIGVRDVTADQDEQVAKAGVEGLK